MKLLMIFFFAMIGACYAVELPSLLVDKNQSDWEQRRVEIKELMQAEVYGFFPKNVEFEHILERKEEVIVEGHRALYTQLRLELKNRPQNYIRLSIWSPLTIQKTPVFLTLNHCGNHTVSDDPLIPIRGLNHHSVYCKEKDRGDLKRKYDVTKVLSHGFSFATYDVSDMDADDARFSEDGIQGAIQTHSDSRRSWGSIAAWAFGLTKAVDALVTTPEINPERIILTGHSRRGKAALLATAMDERIFAVIPHQSGLGGTSSFRNSKFRESARGMSLGSRIYPFLNEPYGLTHFMAPIFQDWSKKAKTLHQLQFDTHMLIALVAPRIVIDTQGKRDFWAGPKAARRSLKEAAPAWEFYGEAVDLDSSHSSLQQVMIPGGHIQDECSWDLFIDVISPLL